MTTETTRRAGLKLRWAEFDFGSHKVMFVGDEVQVYQNVGDERWGLLTTIRNAWSSRGPEQPGVAGREYKPRVTDALQALRAAQASPVDPKRGKK